MSSLANEAIWFKAAVMSEKLSEIRSDNSSIVLGFFFFVDLASSWLPIDDEFLFNPDCDVAVVAEQFVQVRGDLFIGSISLQVAGSIAMQPGW